MSGEPFYTPGKKQTPPKHYWPESSERLWEIRKDHATWSADLRFHGESYGWEAMILRDGDLVISQRFALKAIAVEWGRTRKSRHRGRRRLMTGECHIRSAFEDRGSG